MGASRNQQVEEGSNLIPQMWLPLPLRESIRVLVVLTSFLYDRSEDPESTSHLPERVINPKGGHPQESGRPARIVATGSMGGQARSAEAQIRYFQHNIHAPIFQKAPFSRVDTCRQGHCQGVEA